METFFLGPAESLKTIKPFDGFFRGVQPYIDSTSRFIEVFTQIDRKSKKRTDNMGCAAKGISHYLIFLRL